MCADVSRTHYFHAEANSLGGFIDKPLQKTMPPQASSSLPPVGGHVNHRTEAFHFEGIFSCRSSHTRVSGRHIEEDGSASTVATSVIEGLYIAEVITAERVVAKVSMVHPAKGGAPIVSFTRFSLRGAAHRWLRRFSVIECQLVGGGTKRDRQARADHLADFSQDGETTS